MSRYIDEFDAARMMDAALDGRAALDAEDTRSWVTPREANELQPLLRRERPDAARSVLGSSPAPAPKSAASSSALPIVSSVFKGAGSILDQLLPAPPKVPPPPPPPPPKSGTVDGIFAAVREHPL